MTLNSSLDAITKRAEVEKKLISLARTADSLADQFSDLIALDSQSWQSVSATELEAIITGVCTQLKASVKDANAKLKLNIAYKQHDEEEDLAARETLAKQIAAQDDKDPVALAEFKNITHRTKGGEDYYQLLAITLDAIKGSKHCGDYHETVTSLIAEFTSFKLPCTRTRVKTLLSSRGVPDTQVHGVLRTLGIVEEHINSEQSCMYDWDRREGKPYSQNSNSAKQLQAVS